MGLASALMHGEQPDFAYAGLFSRILSYYGLDYSPAVCFGLGCELGFVLPPADEVERPVAPGFNAFRFHEECSYALGMWFREVRSLQAGTFIHYLDLEWEDFAGKMQPLPILTLLPADAGTLRPVLLVDAALPSGRYTFLCGLSGKLFSLDREELATLELAEYHHAIFHPPLNFLKHATKFRPLRSSIAYALHKTIHHLQAGYGLACPSGHPAIRHLADLLGTATAETYLRGLARYYLTVSRQNLGGNGLYRRNFAEFLSQAAAVTEAGDFEQGARAYRELAGEWGEFLGLCRRLQGEGTGMAEFRALGREQLEALHAHEQQALSLVSHGLAAMEKGGGA